jgi:hypothetical protein
MGRSESHDSERMVGPVYFHSMSRRKHYLNHEDEEMMHVE